jgi:replicative DNA helicase
MTANPRNAKSRIGNLRNIEAEEGVIGGILVNPSMLIDARLFVKPEDFFIHKNGFIFQAMCELTDEGSQLDMILLDEKIKEEYGGPAYLVKLTAQVSHSLHVVEYAKIVSDYARRRKIAQAGHDVYATAFDTGKDIDTVSAEAQGIVVDASSHTGGHGPIDMRQALEEHYDYVSKAQAGEIKAIPTGLIDWDNILAGGLKQQTINLIAARTGMGKTAVLCTVAKNRAIDGGCPAFFSLEQPTAQIMTRLISQDVGVSTDRFDIKDGLTQVELKEWDRAIAGMEKIKFFIDDTPGLNVLEIVNRCRVLKRAHDIDLVLVDYAQLIQPSMPQRMRYLEIKNVLDHLHVCSKELKVPILLAAQLGRDVDARQDHRPILKDLRESGDFEQYGYTITFFHREAFYDPTTINQLGGELIVAKHRQGKTGTADVVFRGQYSRVENAMLKTVHLTQPPSGAAI